MKVDYLSWSKENRLETCGQQFAYIYGEGLRMPPGAALIRGRVAADVAEEDLRRKMDTGSLASREEVEQLATDKVAAAFKGEVSIDGDYEGMSVSQAKAVVGDEARDLAVVYHERIAPEITPTGIELRVRAEFPDLDVPYEGVLDVIDRVETVRDLKTKRKAPPKSLADDSEQLTIYSGFFEALYERKPEKLALDVAWRTPGGKVDARSLETKRTDDDLRIRLARSRRNLEAIEKEVFLPAAVDSWVCSERWCGFTDVCPYFAGRRRPSS